MINYLVCMVLPIRKAHVIREMLSFWVQNLFVNVKITYCFCVYLHCSFNVLKNEKTALAVFRRNFSMTIKIKYYSGNSKQRQCVTHFPCLLGQPVHTLQYPQDDDSESGIYETILRDSILLKNNIVIKIIKNIKVFRDL